MAHNIFDPEADQAKYAFWTRVDPPRKTYAILFTPRSGSSWLTSILTETKAMGTPGEWFNPDLMDSSSRSKGARDLDQFIEAISRHEIHGGIFGFEMTLHQLDAVFDSPEHFMSRFSDAHFFWLIRRDIVAQGVSLHKMAQTNIAHAPGANPEAIAQSDAAYHYNAREIKRWISHIRAAEIETELMITRFGLKPVCLSYEQITAAGANGAAKIFADVLGVDLPEQAELPSEHRKIGTEKNDAFAERFRQENRRFVERLAHERAPMLARHP